ncbi:hypothetical protein HYY71_05940 [Candidatus Woesearchaeota archaeon]|nr:hypothetical protein [Candidatus Woesearchaeota archaeon]
MQFRLHNQARDKILQQINKVLEDGENILNFAQSKSRFSTKEKNKLIKNFEHIKEKGGLCKEGILYALSADKILDSDRRKFQSYQKKLNNINETSINEFLYNRSSKRLLLREGAPVQIR